MEIQKQYTAAAKTSSLDSTARALSSLAEIFRKDGKLPSILAAPTLSAADKSQIVTELLKHTGGGVGTTPSTGNNKNETVKNFLKALADNNRLGILPAVCEKFGSLVSVHRGEVELLVTSAAVCLFSVPSFSPSLHCSSKIQFLMTIQ